MLHGYGLLMQYRSLHVIAVRAELEQQKAWRACGRTRADDYTMQTAVIDRHEATAAASDSSATAVLISATTHRITMHLSSAIIDIPVSLGVHESL
jgi:hypothetical protein